VFIRVYLWFLFFKRIATTGLAVTGPVRDAAAVESRDQGGPVADAAGRCSGTAGQTEAGRAKGVVEDVLHQSGQAAAMADDDQLQLPPQRMVRHDAEIAADIGNDGGPWSEAGAIGDSIARSIA
jgi:hypothetical protein